MWWACRLELREAPLLRVLPPSECVWLKTYVRTVDGNLSNESVHWPDLCHTCEGPCPLLLQWGLGQTWHSGLL